MKRFNGWLSKNPFVSGFITAILAAVMVLAPLYLIGLPPPMTSSVDELGLLGASGDARSGGGIRCIASPASCVESHNGRDIAIYSGAGTTAATLTYRVTGSTGTVQHGGFEIWNQAAAISVTNGITNLTPLGSYQNLTAGGAVTVTSLITSTSVIVTGTVVSLINTVAQDIVLTNGTYLVLPGAANLTLGQWDNVRLRFDGTRWIAIASTNN